MLFLYGEEGGTDYMLITARRLSALYRKSHDLMRDIDGLQPQEALDELLKYLFMKENADESHHGFAPYSLPIFDCATGSLNDALVSDLRHQFQAYLTGANSWSSEMWRDKSFRLSDSALLSVHHLFENVDFTTVDIDVRSAALNKLITSDLRKGLGIFPTPDAVARMMVEVASPPVSSSVLDPACGTGTFLIETLRRWHSTDSSCDGYTVWGVDKSPRMLLLSELNLGHSRRTVYRRALADSLYQPPSTLFEDLPGGLDYILTNPPFGMVVDRDKQDMTLFQTCRDKRGSIVKRQQSEVIFLEQCLKYLRPGGLLGIVLPRSVITNSSLATARRKLNTMGYLEAIINLPPETFSISGTQTNTVILFLRRYERYTQLDEPIEIACADVENVGFDSTGRPRTGNQLASTSKALKDLLNGEQATGNVRLLTKVDKKNSLTELPALLSNRTIGASYRDMMPLSDAIAVATNGRTPSRSAYSSHGLFLVKVGNLTGRGIDWAPRERNFISGEQVSKRRRDSRLMLKAGDIVLTSSAHSPVYIAKKVDLVTAIPQWVGREASFVGEVMLLRSKPGIDPAVLLAYLRLPSIQQQIQSMVRGQTAHLHPNDLLQLLVPKTLFRPPFELGRLAGHIRIEADLASKLNEVSFEQRTLSQEVERVLSTSN